jgi:hypothetical protein
VSLVRVHNFSISVDGFGAEPQSHDAPFGDAGETVAGEAHARRSSGGGHKLRGPRPTRHGSRVLGLPLQEIGGAARYVAEPMVRL